jgi:cytosine/adenosine deaminase-related metal-dependent hydrolase
VCLEFLKTWKDAGIPNADILRAITINGYKVSQTDATRGPIKAGYIADLIAVPGSPLDDVETLKAVQFVMKDGLVFKRDGVMTRPRSSTVAPSTAGGSDNQHGGVGE